MSNADPIPELLLRRAEDPADTETIRQLFREYQEAIGVDLCFQGFAAELAGLPGPYAPPRGGLWLAEAAGTPVGCIALREIDAERAEMKRLFVRPAGRGLGLGRRLVEVLAEEARRLGYRAVCLDTLPTMRTAQALYEELGFHDIPPYCANPVAGARYMALDL
jgi:ribosomal protein S18 acetylase RimI-like enzyme